ncbi:MAG: YkgJ family cysteine cluster protein [Dehalococcoidia bacterium]|nr:YkgJ family cysteine cluster protein [Dehalococcoidia bacterium]MDZ4247558.1 YkgJ family cysteine cluster protein [Dehalococcoidia bacterium]
MSVANSEVKISKWDGLNLKDLRGREAELIEDLRHSGRQINLSVPATADKVTTFFRMFTCQRCGECCRTDGIVLSSNEVERIASFLGISRKQFKTLYTFTRNGGRFIANPCPFLHNDKPGCAIYTSRPQVCRLFPVNTPATDGMLYCNSACPAGCQAAVKILEYQARIATKVEVRYVS